MPMSRALALCPDAVILPPDMAKYSRVGREIRTRMMSLTPLVEPLSIDEAFLDLHGCEQSNGAGAAETLIRFARSVEAEVGVTVSVGLSYCKFLAKLASDLKKPRGFASLSRDEAKAWLSSQSVSLLWGVGRVGRERLERRGFHLIGDLQRIEEREAVLRLGEDGLRLWRLAQGRDDRAVCAERETKSVSSETTFDRDIADKAELTRILLVQCDRVATRLRKEGLAACGVTLKLRLADFSLRTRSRSGLAATQLAPRLFAAARPLLEGNPTASPIACWGSPRRISRRRHARTPTTCSRATAAASGSGRRRLRLCAKNSAPPPCSAALPSGRGQPASERAGPKVAACFQLRSQFGAKALANGEIPDPHWRRL